MLPRVPGSAPRRAEQVWGKVGARRYPSTRLEKGAWRWLFAPRVRLRIDLAAGAVGPAPSSPAPPALTLRWETQNSWVTPWPLQFWRKLRPGPALG